jgi:hypothetical protein
MEVIKIELISNVRCLCTPRLNANFPVGQKYDKRLTLVVTGRKGILIPSVIFLKPDRTSVM